MAAIVIDRPSNGARNLARALGLLRVQPARAAHVAHRTLINWGCSDFAVRANQRVINRPQAVLGAIDKVRALSLVGDDGPPFWTRPEDVVRGKKSIILCRRNFLSEGRGITIVRPGEDLVPADFYVKYIPKLEEYRVHVFGGQVIGVQQKLRRNGAEQTDDQKLVRNHDNGWVFAINQVNLEDNNKRQPLYDAAIRCTQALGLDFAAVDLLIGRDDAKPYFLEANTRPGIESDTILRAYAGAVSGIVPQRRARRGAVLR